VNDDRPPRLAWGMWKRFGLAAFVVIVLTAGATATAGLLEVASFVNDLTPNSSSKIHAHVDPVQPGAPQTILVIGSDRRFKDRRDVHNARSDTIILVRLNADATATTVMSIPRDLKVHLRRRGGRIQTDKINAAYSIGGPDFTAQTVRSLLSTPDHPFKINHIVNVNFGGFRAAVDFIGCVYTDVDRRYFNDNSQAGYGQDYATINLKPGYQRLCGSDALDYVRFRHADTDIVRSARQQDFLRQAKAQYGTGRLVSDRHALARIFGRYTQSDAQLHSVKALLELMTLVVSTAANPIREVHFPAILPNNPNDPYVTARSAGIERAVRQFLSMPGAHGPGRRRPGRAHRRAPRLSVGGVPGMVAAGPAGETQGALLGSGVGMPVYYPKLLPARASYMGPIGGVYPRAYQIHDEHRRAHAAYRMTLHSGELGNYIGVQGTTWMSPPLLAHPSETRTVGGRRLELFFDGPRLRLVAWRTRRAVYWISNSLQEVIGNKQLIATAASFTRLGAGH
jgi:LCP family protein required for cell wall assembly